MAIALGKLVVCPITVGRAHYLEAIRQSIEQTRSGQGYLLLLAGEAGIGKSRLVAEAKRQAEGQGFAILQGHCFELDRSLPYAPLVDLLRTYLFSHSPAELAQGFGANAPEVAKLLPELAPLLPPGAASPALNPEPEKRRLFAVLAQFFIRQVTAQPLLLVVEDLHWSDDVTLEFLLYLAKACVNQRLLCLATYRADEVHERLGHWLAQLDRSRLAQELVLQRLTSAEVDLMVQAIFELKRPVRPEVLGALYALSEGNPFFVEEMLKALVTAGEVFYGEEGWQGKTLAEMHIPRSVQDAVRQRSQRLSEPAKRVLILAAGIGQRFDFSLLAHLAGCGEVELLGLLKDLVAAQLVVEESAEQFAFRHALTRQAIDAQLLLRERQALHRQVAEAIEQVFAGTLEGRWHDLAYHYDEAGVWAKALDYALRAAEAARALSATRVAIEQYTRALQAAHHLTVVPPLTALMGRGSEYEALGDYGQARQDYEQALSLAHSSHDVPSEWQCLFALTYLWIGSDDQRAEQCARDATTLAHTLGNPRQFAESLTALAGFLVWRERSQEALPLLQQALEIFQAQNDQRSIAQTLEWLGWVSADMVEKTQAACYYQQAISRFREVGDIPGLISSLATWAAWQGFTQIADPEVPRRDVEEALRLARRIGWPAGQAWTNMQMAKMLSGTCEVGSAVACACEAVRLIGEIERQRRGSPGGEAYGEPPLTAPSLAPEASRPWLAHRRRSPGLATDVELMSWKHEAYMFLGVFYNLSLAPDQALQNLATALALVHEREPHIANLIRSQIAYAYILQGDLKTAEATLNAAMPRGQALRNWRQQFVAWIWLELTLAQGEAELALHLGAQWFESEPHADLALKMPSWARLKGEALLGLNRLGEAERSLNAARSTDLPLLQWRVHGALAHLYDQCGRVDEARREIDAARTIIDRMAATINDVSLRENFIHRAFATLEISQPAAVGKKPPLPLYGRLTPREREVAVQIVQGKSNAEIAQALVLSERTVEYHVGNILNKLGYTSRTQIAAWVVESGLAKGPSS